MKHFYKIAYNTSKEEAIAAYQQRINAVTAKRLPLSIRPIEQQQTFPLYYLPTNEMIKRCCMLHRHHDELQKLFDSLPELSRQQFLLEMVLAEMRSTIEIDGDTTNRIELVDSLRAILEPAGKAKRFSGLARSYYHLASDDCIEIRTPRDIRNLYDELVGGAIKRGDAPDGELFRKETVSVTRKIGSGKVIHQGVTPESEIIGLLESLFYMMDDDSLPNLVKIAIFHYFFGYVHPFYDGNGRMARFIASCMLRNELGPMTALLVARACNTNDKKYAELFEITNSARNRGEMNAFIEGFLALIDEGQQGVILELQQKKSALSELEERIAMIDVLAFKGNGAACDVLHRLAQHDLFTDDDSGLTLSEFHELIQPDVGSRQSLRLTLNELESRGLVKSVGLKPKRYFVNMAFISDQAGGG